MLLIYLCQHLFEKTQSQTHEQLSSRLPPLARRQLLGPFRIKHNFVSYIENRRVERSPPLFELGVASSLRYTGGLSWPGGDCLP